METLIDFSDIDFVIACRIDNHERGLNAFLVYNYFRGWSKNSHFIFVEDAITPALANYVPIDESDKIIFEKNEGAFRKCRSYNIGLQYTTRPFICFIDIDVILDPEQIFRVKKNIQRKEAEFGIPYNGYCFYLDQEGKDFFSKCTHLPTLKSMTYDAYKERIDKLKDVRWSGNFVKFPFFTLTGNNSMGGCIIGKKESFLDIKGFNENFKGWGYEDSEIISRIKILEKPIVKAGKKTDIMYHFPHTKNTVTVDIDNQKSYLENKREIDKIENMDKASLSEYIDSWQWLK